MEKWRGAQRHLGIVEVDSEDPRSPPKVLLHQPEIEAEGVRHPKFSLKQAAAESQGSGGRLNHFYSAVEQVCKQYGHPDGRLIA